jgi:hypothetical protein
MGLWICSVSGSRQFCLTQFYGRIGGEGLTYTTKELSPETWPDFDRLFAPSTGRADYDHGGTISMFEREGFAVVARPDAPYVVMQRRI